MKPPSRRRGSLAGWAGTPLALIALFALEACGRGTRGTAGLVAGQFATMRAVGYVPHGTLSQGAIERGQVRSHPVELRAGRCYRLLALGEDGWLDLEAALYTPAGRRAQESLTSGGSASLEYCASESGVFRFVVSSRAGAGSYLASAWERDEVTSGENATRGTCVNPVRIALGERLRGSLARAIDNAAGRCAAGRNPDVAHLLEIERRQRVVLVATGSQPRAVYLRRSCAGAGAGTETFGGTTLACAVSRGADPARLDLTLEPGSYFVFVEALGDGPRGAYELATNEGESAQASDVCARATPLTLGSVTRGSTSRATDVLHGSCASSGFPGPDVTYAMEVPERLRVRVSVEADGAWDTGVYLRASCVDPESERACNDDADDRFHAVITQNLDPGRYAVTVDGFSTDARGPFSLAVESSPLDGAGISGDACTDAASITVGGRADGDTFAARDDVALSCGGRGPDQLFRFTLARRALVRATLAERGIGASPDVGLGFVRGCEPAGRGGAVGESACARTGSIDAILPAGVHYLVVDGATREAYGRFSVALASQDPEPVEAACRASVPLRIGGSVSGMTAGQPDRLHASCGRGGRSGDATHTLSIPREGRVTLELRARSFDGVLSLRRACERETTELGCSAESEQGVVRLALDVAPGDYTVVVDGFDRNNTGAYELAARLD
jgi:hypothetical protein